MTKTEVLLHRRQTSKCIVYGEVLAWNTNRDTDAPLTHPECSQQRRKPKFNRKRELEDGIQNLDRLLGEKR